MTKALTVASNAAYLVLGVFIINNGNTYDPINGAVLILLGATSALFHFYRNEFVQTLDAISMQLALTVLFLSHFSDLTGMPVSFMALAVILIGIGYGTFRPHLNSKVVVGALGAGTLLLLLVAGHWVSAIIAPVVFLAAFLVRQIDHPMDHGPHHFWWHVATAIAYGAAYFPLM